MLISLIKQLDPEGRAHAYTNRPQQPHVTEVSAPALPEVQGFSDGGQLSHSIVTACMLIE